jgi:outer membrane protein OmpA-like peptidoglycan-associated protein
MLSHRFFKFLFLQFFVALPSLISAQNPARSGTDHAVFFYVTDFQPDWPRLPETKTEVEAIAAKLKDDYGFSVEFVRNPTKADIENKILEINQRKYGSKDQLLLFFSMHGHFIASADRGYLVPSDGKTPPQDPLGKSWLSYDDLGAYLSQNPCKHILLSLDACYSGAFGMRQNAAERTKTYPGAVKADAAQECKSIETEALFAESYLYFTAGGNQRAPAQSKFADAWLKALGEGWLKKVITTNELRYAFGNVRNPAPEGGLFSRKTNGGDFVFMHKTACAAAPPIDKAADKAAWNRAKDANTFDAYRQYIADFPDGEFRPLVEKRINELEREQQEELAWESAKKSNTVKAYDDFILEYPNGTYEDLAQYKRNDLLNNNDTQTLKKDNPKEPIRKGKVILLENIYYDFNQHIIRQGASEELDALAKLMGQYPSMEIELSAHTDSQGNDDYNYQLSLKRAESAKNYLIQKGIKGSRINAMGLGETQIRNRCADGVVCSDIEHQYNRRIEVKVVRINEPVKVQYGEGNPNGGK